MLVAFFGAAAQLVQQVGDAVAEAAAAGAEQGVGGGRQADPRHSLPGRIFGEVIIAVDAVQAGRGGGVGTTGLSFRVWPM